MRRLRSTRRAVAWRVAVCLVALAAIGQTTVFSGASFTSNRSSNPGNLIVAGMLHGSNTKDGQLVVDASGIRPGQTITGTFSLTNDGTAGGIYQFFRISLSDAPASPALSGALTLTITDTTRGIQLYSGAMNALTMVSAGPAFGVGETRAYSVAVIFPTANAVPSLQGASCDLTLGIGGTSL